MQKIECLVDAIGRTNGMGDPESQCYRLRNPLLIRSFARPGKHETDEHGKRVFSSFLSGYKAGLFDIELKMTGKSRAGLTSASTLAQLLGVYGITEPGGVSTVVSFLRRALKDLEIKPTTLLSYFLQESI